MLYFQFNFVYTGSVTITMVWSVSPLTLAGTNGRRKTLYQGVAGVRAQLWSHQYIERKTGEEGEHSLSNITHEVSCRKAPRFIVQLVATVASRPLVILFQPYQPQTGFNAQLPHSQDIAGVPVLESVSVCKGSC